ncbi:MCE family protein [Alteromonas gracilis]
MIRNRTLGVAFVVMMLLAVWLVNAVFTQRFTDWDEVTLRADKIGLQLPERADVKVRGEIVGQVLATETSAQEATLTLGIQPDRIGAIPSNVTASLVPKTLFGEKYVNLVLPDQSSGAPLAAGDEIDETDLPIEVEEVLNDLYPLLRTVQPAELNYTLNAVATALEGRGDDLGENLVVLEDYLTRLNPQLPALVEDLRLLSTVSDTYAAAIPDLAATLRNTVTTGRTFREKQQQINTFLRDVTAFSGTAEQFLDANGDNITRLARLSEPQLALLRKYSPEFPCLLGGLVNQAPLLADTFRGFVFHINLRVLPKQPRGYRADEVPVYGAKNGPRCGALPSPPWSQERIFRNVPDLADGAEKPDKRVAPDLGQADAAAAERDFMTSFAPMSATPEEKAVVTSLTAPVLGRPADQVGDLTTLLYGPLLRGSEVSVG